jgi:hypothetical protein
MATKSDPTRGGERFPFGMPSSWFVAADSSELAAGGLRHLKYFGEGRTGESI